MSVNSGSAIANNIKKIIRKRGMKQYIVAKKAGYSISQFNAMLNGRKIIRAEDIVVLADVLNATPNAILGVKKKEK